MKPTRQVANRFKLTCMALRPTRIMKPFALSWSLGFCILAVLRQAQRERVCFTSKP